MLSPDNLMRMASLARDGPEKRILKNKAFASLDLSKMGKARWDTIMNKFPTVSDTKIAMNFMHEAVHGRLPPALNSHDLNCTEMYNFLAVRDNTMDELSPVQLTLPRMLVDNVHCVYRMMYKYGVIENGNDWPVKNRAEAALLPLEEKVAIMEAAWKDVQEYVIPSPRFVRYLMGCRGQEYVSDCVAFLFNLTGKTVHPTTAGETWREKLADGYAAHHLWSLERLMDPRNAGWLWILAEFECGIHTVNFISEDGTKLHEKLGRLVSKWMVFHNQVSAETVASIARIADAKDTYATLQVGLAMGKTLPSTMYDIVTRILSFLYWIGDRTDELLRALAEVDAEDPVPTKLSELTRLIQDTKWECDMHIKLKPGVIRLTPLEVSKKFTSAGLSPERVVSESSSSSSTNTSVSSVSNFVVQKKLPKTNATANLIAERKVNEDLAAAAATEDAKLAAAKTAAAKADAMEVDGSDSSSSSSGSEVEDFEEAETEFEQEDVVVTTQTDHARGNGGAGEAELLALKKSNALLRTSITSSKSDQQKVAADTTDKETQKREAVNKKRREKDALKRKVAKAAGGTTKRPLAGASNNKKNKKTRAEEQDDDITESSDKESADLLDELLESSDDEDDRDTVAKLLAGPNFTKTLLNCLAVQQHLFTPFVASATSSKAEKLSTLYKVTRRRAAAHDLIMLCRGASKEWAVSILQKSDNVAWDVIGPLEQALFRVLESSESTMEVKMVMLVGAAVKGADTVTWPAKSSECVVEYPSDMGFFITAAGKLAALYESKRKSDHPRVSESHSSTSSQLNQTPRTVNRLDTLDNRPQISRPTSAQRSDSAGGSANTGNFSSLSSSQRGSSSGMGLFGSDNTDGAECGAFTPPATSRPEPTYAAVHGQHRPTISVSMPDQFNTVFSMPRNSELVTRMNAAAALRSAAGIKHMKVITGTEEGGELDPMSLTAANMVDRLIRRWFARLDRLSTETVCHAEHLNFIAGGDEEVTTMVLFLDFKPQYLHRSTSKFVELKHFLPRDSNHNWADVDTPERLILGIRGLGHFFFFLLCWKKVMAPLLDELIEQRVFHRWSIRYFLQELYLALSSIPERVRTIRVLAEDIEDAPMEDFVYALSQIKVRMNQDGSDRMYSTLKFKAGGPGVDTLIGTAHSTTITAPIVATVAAPVTQLPKTCAPPSRDSHRSRSRDRNRDSRGAQSNNDRRGREADRGSYRDDKRGGFTAGRQGEKKDFCFDDILYVLRMDRQGCRHAEKCYKLHGHEVRSYHSLASAERQAAREFDMGDLEGEGQRLKKALRDHKDSPWFGGKCNK